ncbi:hypothetical protein TWF481_002732 [Arthrobotrys musiformis]|uniref:Uncharacterized protein n=1 Tax=Arthrobotrys musiformis TaxID=47236 RepID=A0AAV9VR72_9PEZI
MKLAKDIGLRIRREAGLHPRSNTLAGQLIAIRHLSTQLLQVAGGYHFLFSMLMLLLSTVIIGAIRLERVMMMVKERDATVPTI